MCLESSLTGFLNGLSLAGVPGWQVEWLNRGYGSLLFVATAETPALGRDLADPTPRSLIQAALVLLAKA